MENLDNMTNVPRNEKVPEEIIKKEDIKETQEISETQKIEQNSLPLIEKNISLIKEALSVDWNEYFKEEVRLLPDKFHQRWIINGTQQAGFTEFPVVTPYFKERFCTRKEVPSEMYNRFTKIETDPDNTSEQPVTIKEALNISLAYQERLKEHFIKRLDSLKDTGNIVETKN